MESAPSKREQEYVASAISRRASGWARAGAARDRTAWLGCLALTLDDSDLLLGGFRAPRISARKPCGWRVHGGVATSTRTGGDGIVVGHHILSVRRRSLSTR